MKTKLLITTILILSYSQLFAQKYMSRNANLSFFSSTPVEDIEAHNHQGSCVVDFSNGNVAFQALMKGFEFKKALMQEHFNENYVESKKYPKTTFDGKITNYTSVDLKKEGVYQVNVTGKLTIHGVTKNIETPGTIEVKGGDVILKSKFKVKPADYNIKIPNVVRKNIAEIVEITVDAVCSPI